MTPAAILAKALAPYDGPALWKLADVAGVSRQALRRARGGAHGRSTSADVHLRLCLALGVDPIDGHAIPVAVPRDVAAHSLAVALRMRRMELRHNNRTAAAAMGISITTLSRLENGITRSIDSMLAACRYIGQHPFQYLAPAAPVTREIPAGNKHEQAA